MLQSLEIFLTKDTTVHSQKMLLAIAGIARNRTMRKLRNLQPLIRQRFAK